MWTIILTAIAFLLIIEGIVPFISPNGCRKMMAAMIKYSNTALRLMGLVAVLAGIIIIYLVHL